MTTPVVTVIHRPNPAKRAELEAWFERHRTTPPMAQPTPQPDVSYVSFTFKGEKREFLIDTADLPLVSEHKWHGVLYAYGENIAIRTTIKVNGKQKCLRLTRLLIEAPSELDVDHIDGNSLNFRRRNLRVVEHYVNVHNRNTPVGKSGYRNVLFKGGKYRVAIRVKGKHCTFGNGFNTAEEANEYAIAVRKQLGIEVFNTHSRPAPKEARERQPTQKTG